MAIPQRKKRTARFILTQLAVSALVLAALFIIPISMLLEQQIREGDAADAIAAQSTLLQTTSHLADAVVHGGLSDGAKARMALLVRRARANEAKVTADLPVPEQRQMTHDLGVYTDAALMLRGNGTDVPLYREMVDLQIDLMQMLSSTERTHLDRSRRQSNWVYEMIGCAIVALLMLLGSGWASLFDASRSEARLLERVASATEEDVHLSRMEELYLIVASSGVDATAQMESALKYAEMTLDFEWAMAVEWVDGEEAVIAANTVHNAFRQPLEGDCALEKAIALEASRRGEPITLRFDRLPPEFTKYANAPRPFPWRQCAAYSFPGDYTDRAPHCALFLGSRRARAEALSTADEQFIRLVGTLVSSSSRSARHQKRLDDLAFADPLTGMPNRALLGEQLEGTIATANVTGKPFAVHYIDLDGFKNVNDVDGHEVGDEVLKLASARMRQVLRKGDTLARIGGDEFVALQLSASTVFDAIEVAERVVERLATPFVIDGRKHRIGGSIGIAMYPDHGRSSVELLRHADAALYESKRLGKGRASIYGAAGPEQANDVA